MDSHALTALYISTIAGLSTVFGAFIVFFKNAKSDKMITFSLGFAAGVMISISFTDLLPASQNALVCSNGPRMGVVLTVVFLIAGILAAMAIDQFVPHEDYDGEHHEKPHKNLFRVGMVSMIAIMLHNFPEGIATFMATYKDLALGLSVAVAIMMHNIPEGVSVAMPIYYATGNKFQAIKYTFISGIAEPIGALLAFWILRPFINDLVLGAIFAVLAGIMLYISFEELLPSSRQYGFNRLALFSTFLGICVMPLSHILYANC